MQTKHRKHPGIEVRRTGRGTTYRAEAFDQRTGKRRYNTFPTLTAAKGWRTDALSALRAGTLAPDAGVTVREASEELLAGMEAGTIRNRSGHVYKPATIRSYRRAFRLRLWRAFGPRKLGDVRRRDVQAFIDRLAGEGLDGSTIRNTIDPLRVVFRRALTRELVTVNPMQALEIPSAAGRRDRIASPEEGARLIAAVPEGDRPVWATAMYAGLRRGELTALRWSDIDLAAGVIRVRRGWDPKAGMIEVKSRAGRRSVPIAGRLRDVLLDHKLLTGRDGDALAFGVTATTPLEQSNLRRRARTAWKAAKLTPITLHECRRYVRQPGHRRRPQCQGPERVPGPRERVDHLRPLRPPNARQRGGGGWAARCLPAPIRGAVEGQSGAGSAGFNRRQPEPWRGRKPSAGAGFRAVEPNLPLPRGRFESPWRYSETAARGAKRGRKPPAARAFLEAAHRWLLDHSRQAGGVGSARSAQGRGIGALLLRDAMRRTVAASSPAGLGIRAMLVHALDDSARAFYLRHGFQESPTAPHNLQILVKDLEASITAAST